MIKNVTGVTSGLQI